MYLTLQFWCLYWQLKRKTDMVNQIEEPNELNTGVLQTPVSGKGGKPKKSSRSVKSNKTGTQASNAGDFRLNSLCFRSLLASPNTWLTIT